MTHRKTVSLYQTKLSVDFHSKRTKGVIKKIILSFRTSVVGFFLSLLFGWFHLSFSIVIQWRLARSRYGYLNLLLQRWKICHLKICKGGNFSKAHAAGECDCVEKNFRDIPNTVSIVLFNSQNTSGIEYIFRVIWVRWTQTIHLFFFITSRFFYRQNDFSPLPMTAFEVCLILSYDTISLSVT